MVLALFAQVALVQLWIDEQEVQHIYGLQPHHRLVCHALGLDPSWYAVPLAQKSTEDGQTTRTWGDGDQGRVHVPKMQAWRSKRARRFSASGRPPRAWNSRSASM